jgi:hypothetical protein
MPQTPTEWAQLVQPEGEPSKLCELCQSDKFQVREWKYRTMEHPPETEFKCVGCDNLTFEAKSGKFGPDFHSNVECPNCHHKGATSRMWKVTSDDPEYLEDQYNSCDKCRHEFWVLKDPEADA